MIEGNYPDIKGCGISKRHLTIHSNAQNDNEEIPKTKDVGKIKKLGTHNMCRMRAPHD